VIKAFGWKPIPPADLDQLDKGLKLASELAELARDSGVRMMIDAEQTYFQPAIDAIAMQLQARYNTEVGLQHTTQPGSPCLA
jgi:proline dehydrogenase